MSCGRSLCCFKYCITGEAEIGKDYLAHRFCNNRFGRPYNSGSGVEFLMKTITLSDTKETGIDDGKNVGLQVWQTCGQERFTNSLSKHWYRGARFIILCYDINSRKSFERVKYWYQDAREKWSPQYSYGQAKLFTLHDYSVQFAVVGTKLDLVVGENKKRDSTCVSREEGQELAKELRAPVWMETSAKTGENVVELFTAITKVALQCPLTGPSGGPHRTGGVRLPPAGGPVKRSKDWCTC